MDSIAVPYQSCLPKHFLAMTLNKVNEKAAFTSSLLTEVLTPGDGLKVRWLAHVRVTEAI